MDHKNILAFAMLLVSAVSAGNIPRLVEPPPRHSLPGERPPKPEPWSGHHSWEVDCPGQQDVEKCGLCGEPVGSARQENEVLQPRRPAVRQYKAGETMKTMVNNGKNMGGWMEFRLCARDDPAQEVTSQCLQQNVLQLADGTGTRFRVTKEMQVVKTGVEIPDDVSCTHCVLQWHYQTGLDEFGNDCNNCGPHGHWYNCADVIIHPKPTPLPEMTTENTLDDVTMDEVMRDVMSYRGLQKTQQQEDSASLAKPDASKNCHAIGKWAGKKDMDKWCQQKCSFGPEYCLDQICKC